MKNLYIAVFCFLMALPAAPYAAGEENYNDVKTILKQLVSIQKGYIQALKKAKKDDEVVAAINTFGDSLITLHPKITEINTKYPELRSYKKIPGDISLLIESSKEYNKKVQDMTLIIVYRFSYKKNVKKAIEEMHTRLSSHEN